MEKSAINSKAKSISKNQQGQSSVLVAMTAVVFIAFLAFLANIGKVIHDKMLTQAVADAAVLSAANVQTVGMNEIADLNAEINKLAEECNDDFERANNKFGYGNGWITYAYYSTQIKYLYNLQDEAMEDFAEMAGEAAQRIVDLNNENYNRLHPNDGGPHRSFNPIEEWTIEEVMGESSPSQQMGELSPVKIKLLTWTDYWCYPPKCTSSETVGTFQNHRDGVTTDSFNYNVTTPGGGVLFYEQYLSPSTKVYYRARVRRANARALVDMDRFGFAVNIPEIVAYSQAQPNKGNIKKMIPDYEARLAPLWQTYPNETSDEDYLDIIEEDEFYH